MKTFRLSKSTNQSNSKRIHRRLGGAVVEFAIVVPLFLLFLFAAIEFGRLNMVRHMVDNAAYEAARNAMVPGATTQEAVDEANRVLALTGITGAQIHIATVQLGETSSSSSSTGGNASATGVANASANGLANSSANGLGGGNTPPANEQIDDETVQVTVTVTVPFTVNALLSPVFAKDANVVRSSTLKTERYYGIQETAARREK